MSVKDKKYLKAYVSCGVATYCNKHCEPYIECEAKIKVKDYLVEVEINDEPKTKFELTAEEVEIARKLFVFAKEGGRYMFDSAIEKGSGHNPLLCLSIIRNADYLLTRIKQWQDGEEESNN